VSNDTEVLLVGVLATRRFLTKVLFINVAMHTGILIVNVLMHSVATKSRDGLVGYDAALTQLRSRVRFPVFVFYFCFLRKIFHGLIHRIIL
jgi:uncharacterized membrane protein YcfT